LLGWSQTCDPSASASSLAGITGAHHHTWLENFLLIKKILLVHLAHFYFFCVIITASVWYVAWGKARER
jgi:hypothetical protein